MMQPNTDKLQIYFSEDSLCYDINVLADSIDKIKIEDGFLKVHDTLENCWHCYNMNEISHFHYPDKGVKINDPGKHRSSN